MDKHVLLVVEDNPANQLVVSALAERYGFDVVAVKSGKEAIELLQRETSPFSAILMDLNMPIMNGIECTKAIRQLEFGSGRRTPIIGVSAHTAESFRKECLAEGMDDYLSKPFEPNHFRSTLNYWTSCAATSNLRSFNSDKEGRETA